jgi:integrase
MRCRAVAEGRDPAGEKTQARTLQPDTVETVAQQFVERHCLRNNRPSTAAVTQGLLNLYVLSRWRNRLLRDITRRDVRDLLDRIVDAEKPIAANRTLAAIRKLFNWALERDIIDASPCAGIKRPSLERSRERVLSDDELRAVWQAAGRLNDPFGSLVRLLVLTGQRRGEVAGMRWSELDLEGALWKLPAGRVKNAKGHDVSLSRAALDLLAGLPRIGDFVLTLDGTAPVRDYARGKRRLDALLPPDMPPWTLHDLRRTAATGLARLGVNLVVIEKILNHVSGSLAGIVGVYQRHEFADEKRAALQQWADHVERLVRS